MKTCGGFSAYDLFSPALSVLILKNSIEKCDYVREKYIEKCDFAKGIYIEKCDYMKWIYIEKCRSVL